jgi:8-oxo-dGTP pyrophosphatase MutT (NUDIX family)
VSWRVVRLDLSDVAAREPAVVDDEPRRAAVLAAVLSRSDGDYLLFIRRADHLGEHAGQMGFPGGGREPSDTDLRATALREADEEVGLRADEVKVVGCLDDIRTVSEYAVRPFVGRVPDRPYAPGDREVAEVVALPVAGLLDRENYESERREHPHYGEVRLHFFHVDGDTVWGATGRMVVQLLELTTGWRAPAAVDRVVDPDADVDPETS